jgi:hypothetical protein
MTISPTPRRCERTVPAPQRWDDLECRTNRTLGIVLVRQGHAEGCHHRVAGELLDRAAMRLDAAGDNLEVAIHALANDIGIRARDESRRVDEIGEQNRGDLALHSRIVRAANRSAHHRPGTVPARHDC